MEQLQGSPCGHMVDIGNGLQAFVPAPIPRTLDLGRSLVFNLDKASRAISMLAGVGETISNPHLLIRPFMRKEAVLSSRIEGTQASLSDLFIYEASGKPNRDVVEVANYIHALERGIERLNEIPISMRLINEIHSVLLEGVRGQNRRPGVVRDEQVWIGSEGTQIGEARFIPPPAYMIRDLMLDLEEFVNESPEMPPLVQCGLMHYQLEAIHPYFDGNGRIGRLLNILFLYAKNILPTPLLYLSAYFERDRNQYYDQLLRVSVTGDWETWLEYFLKGITEQAQDALRRVRLVRALHEKYVSILMDNKESGNTFRLVDELFASPAISIPGAAEILGLTQAGARRIIGRLERYGMVERLGQYWPRLYAATDLLQVIQSDIAEG